MENEFKIGELTGNTVTFVSTNYNQYKVNVDKIKTIEDIKLILKHLNLYLIPRTKEEFEEMKHLLIIN